MNADGGVQQPSSVSALLSRGDVDIVMENDTLLSIDDEAFPPMDVDDPMQSNVIVETSTVVPAKRGKPSAAGKKKDAIVIAMVHGDMVVLSGDNFEVSYSVNFELSRLRKLAVFNKTGGDRYL